MRHRVKDWIASGKHWHVIVAFFAAIALLSILWAASAIGTRPCRLDGSPCPSLIEDASPLVVALGFGAAGLVAWFAGQAGWGAVFFLLTSGAMAAGMLADIAGGADQPSRWFYLLLAWLAPIIFQFHHSLLDRPPRRLGKAVQGLSYSYAVLVSLPFMEWATTPLTPTGWFLILRSATRLSLVLAIALGWLLLFREYRQGSSPNVRRRIRLIVFGTLFAFAPFVLLSLIPETLGIPDHVPYELTFPWLLLSPLSYLYSLFRHRLAKAEMVFSRAAVYYLLTILFLSVYLIAVALLNQFVASSTVYWPIVSAGLSVALLLLFSPLKHALGKFLTWVLYGSEISYNALIGQLAESLAITLDRETLRHLLLDDLPAALRLSCCALWLQNRNSELVLYEGNRVPSPNSEISIIDRDGQLAQFLAAASAPIPRAELSKRVRGLFLSPDDEGLVAQADWHYWLPLVSGGVLYGILLVGHKLDSEYFTAEDERILATVAHQSAIAVHNLHLIEEVRAGRQQLSRAHRQLLATRERERRRLARELHDEAMQNLLGLTYQLATERKAFGNGEVPLNLEEHAQALEAIRSGALAVVKQLRALIGELRPAGLEEMGLTAAIGSYVDHLKQDGGPDVPDIRLGLTGDVKRIPPHATVCLFRTAQEALRNSVRHAKAQSIRLRLQVYEHQAELVVLDDGCGFRVPPHLTNLASDGHYGLLGMAEQAAWTGGTLRIRSEPGAGTEVRVVIPLDSAEGDDGKEDSSTIGG